MIKSQNMNEPLSQVLAFFFTLFSLLEVATFNVHTHTNKSQYVTRGSEWCCLIVLQQRGEFAGIMWCCNQSAFSYQLSDMTEIHIQLQHLRVPWVKASTLRVFPALPKQTP